MSDRKKIYLSKKGTKSNSWSRHRASISKRKQPLNRYAAEADIEGVSASAKKRRQSTRSRNIDMNAEFGYRFINFVSVMNAISQVVVCKTCGQDVKITESTTRGLGFKIVISCSQCEQTEIPNCPYVRNGYEINHRLTLAMRLLGVGLNGIKKFCAFMELPRPIYHSFYDKLVQAIAIATKAVSASSIQRAAAEEKAVSLEKGQNDGLTVAGETSSRWLGFNALYGVTYLHGWFTGKVIDAEVKLRHCKSCESWRGKEQTSEFREWYKQHRELCVNTHEGFDGNLDADSIVEMFGRSEELHGTKYAYYVGDGIGEVFKAITDSAPYEDLIVQQKGCTDDMQNCDWTAFTTAWSLAPKGPSGAKLILNIATDIAVCTTNDGLSSIMDIMKVLGMTIGPNCYNFCLEVDALRLDYAKRSLPDSANGVSSSVQSSKKTQEKQNLTLQGQLHGAGIAN